MLPGKNARTSAAIFSHAKYVGNTVFYGDLITYFSLWTQRIFIDNYVDRYMDTTGQHFKTVILSVCSTLFKYI